MPGSQCDTYEQALEVPRALSLPDASSTSSQINRPVYNTNWSLLLQDTNLSTVTSPVALATRSTAQRKNAQGSEFTARRPAAVGLPTVQTQVSARPGRQSCQKFHSCECGGNGKSARPFKNPHKGLMFVSSKTLKSSSQK